jgi:hypothetical protein
MCGMKYKKENKELPKGKHYIKTINGKKVYLIVE